MQEKRRRHSRGFMGDSKASKTGSSRRGDLRARVLLILRVSNNAKLPTKVPRIWAIRLRC